MNGRKTRETISLWKKKGEKSHAEQKYCAEILKNSSNSQIDRPARRQIILTGEVISLTFLQVCKRVRDIGTNNDDNQFSVQAFSPYVWAVFFFFKESLNVTHPHTPHPAQRRKSTAHIYPHIMLGGGGGGPRLQDRAYPEAKLHGSTKGHLSDSLLEACSF